jgi:ubiquinone biosynthesis protein
VLTLQRVGGVKISDVAALDRLGLPRRAVAENGVRSFLREVLEFGFFHADPHPGNFFVQPDGALAIVDFGMVGRVSEVTQNRLLRAGLAALRQDSETLAEQLYALGVAGRRANRVSFQKDLDHLIGHYGQSSLRELSARTVIDELVRIVLRHKLQLPTELALLLRVANMSEGMGLVLDPGFHYFEYASPIFKRTWRERHSLRAGIQRMSRAALDAAEMSAELPHRLELLLGRLERGEIQLSVRHEGLDAVTREFQRMTNRLALSVILAASVVALGIGAGIRHTASLDPVMYWLLRLGLFFSLAFGVAVLWGIWRAGRR